MESLFLAINVVVPLIIYMSVGGLIRRLGILSEDHFKKINSMIFKILLPLTLFFNVYGADLESAFQPKLFISTAVMVIAMYLFSIWLSLRLTSDKRDASAFAQGIYRSNYVLLGTTIGASLCGDAGAAMTAALSVLAIPLYNMLAVILFEAMRGGNVKIRELILHIFQNPLVDAGILGGLAGLFRIPIPQIIQTPLKNLADISTPLALLALGGMLSMKSMVSHRRLLSIAVAFRLVIFPFAAMAISVILGFRNVELVTLFSVFASPTAVSSAPMAQSMGGNGILAGEIVVLTSLCSLLTIFLFVLGLSGLGLI